MTTIDYATLHDAASRLADVIADAAALVDWAAGVEVAAGEPSYDCDAVYVWVDQIVPEIGQGGCVTASTVRFRIGVADCVGADIDEEEILTSAEDHMRRIWAVWLSIADACCNSDTLLGPNADTVRVGTMSQVTTSGGVAVWSGSVTAVVARVNIT